MQFGKKKQPPSVVDRFKRKPHNMSQTVQLTNNNHIPVKKFKNSTIKVLKNLCGKYSTY